MAGHEFVNRDQYIKYLHQILESLSDNGCLPKPVFLTLIGISGIGKTTLLREFQTICQSSSPPYFASRIDLLRTSPYAPDSTPTARQMCNMQIEILQAFVSALDVVSPRDAYHLDQLLDELRHGSESDCPETAFEQLICELTHRIVSTVTDQKGIVCFDAMERASSSLIIWLEKEVWWPLLDNSSGLALFLGSRNPVQFSNEFLRSRALTRRLDCLAELDSIALSRQICPECAELIYDITRGLPLFDVIVAEALQQIETELNTKIDASNFKDVFPRLLTESLRPLIERRILGHVPEATKRLYRQFSPVRTFDLDLVKRISPILGLPTNGVGPTMIAAQLEQTGLISWQRGRAYVSEHTIRRPTAMDLKLHEPDLFLGITDALVSYYAEQVREGANQIDPGASICEWAYHFAQQGLAKGDSLESIEHVITEEMTGQIQQAARQSAVADAVLRDFEDDWELRSLFSDRGLSLINRIQRERELQEAKVNKNVVHLSILISNIEGSPDQRITAILSHKGAPADIVREKLVSGTVIQMIMRSYYDLLTRMSKEHRILTEPSLQAFESELATVGQLLYRRLLKPDMQELVRCAVSDGSLVLTVNRPDIPWEILHDGNGFLSLMYPFSRKDTSPLTLKYSERTAYAVRSVLIVADPNTDLPQAREEADSLHALLNHGDKHVVVLTGADANYMAVSEYLLKESFDLVHFAGHAIYRRDSVTRTGLVLANHEILSVEDIISSGLRGGPVVFLNACEAARNEEAFLLATYTPRFTCSLVSSFIQAGARACLGSVTHIPDATAAWFSEKVYSQFLEKGVPLGTAIREVREGARLERQAVSWLSYILYGDPDIRCKDEAN